MRGWTFLKRYDLSDNKSVELYLKGDTLRFYWPNNETHFDRDVLEYMRVVVKHFRNELGAEGVITKLKEIRPDLHMRLLLEGVDI